MKMRATMFGLAAALGLVAGGVAVAMPDVVKIPVVKPHPEGGPPQAIFRHGKHDSVNCYRCHPHLFPKWKEGFSHAEMNEGRFCGACHDGKTGFDWKKADCGKCHAKD